MSVCFPYVIQQQANPTIAEPILSVTLKNRDNPTILVNTEMYLDSGAFISLAPRSYADLLELNLYTGIPLHLTGITGKSLPAYAHLLKMEIAGVNIDLPIAITEKDFSFLPPLLGNLGVWEQIQTLTFDNTNMRLCVADVIFKDQTITMQWLQRQAQLATITNVIKAGLITAAIYLIVK